MGRYRLSQDGHVGLFLRVQTGSQDYMSSWRSTDFPDFGSETEQSVQWFVGGVGLEVETPPLFTFGTGADFRFRVDGMVGYGSYDYAASQVVSSPPSPDRLFAVEDHETRAAFGYGAEAVVRTWVGDALGVDFFAGVDVFTLPTIAHVTGNQLEQGLQNELDFVDPRRYFLGARLRF